MAIPMAGGKMKDLLALYREAWREAGHPGKGRGMLAFHMFCAESKDHAAKIARAPLNRYLKQLVAAASDWIEGTNSADYPNYDKVIGQLAKETYETQVAKGAAWAGAPDDMVEQICAYDEMVGGFEEASLQVNFGAIPLAAAKASVRRFAAEVMPKVNARLGTN